MTYMKRTLDFTARRKLRLSEIERIIRIDKIITPMPTRRALQRLCESGELEGVKLPLIGKRQYWFVFEDSFLKWIKETNEATSV